MTMMNNDKVMKNIQKKKTSEEVYQAINRYHVQLKREDKKRNNNILKSVLCELLKIMRIEPLFANMKPRLEYLGSYYDGLRVGLPNEYDINLILKIPVDYNRIKLDAQEANYDYTIIYMPSEFRRLSTRQTIPGFEGTERWCDRQYRLSVKEFRSWMQGVVARALASLPEIELKSENDAKPEKVRVLEIKGKSYSLSSKMSGPANTIKIYVENNPADLIDVDLVPTFKFNTTAKIPVKTKVDFGKIVQTDLVQYFVVPKPYATNTENRDPLADFYWRLTFPFQERHCIREQNNLKSTAKLIKLLRDVQEFKGLVSYFIKTLFLWETADKSDNFWKYNSLSFLVLHMMKILRDALVQREIKNYWCPESNLIRGKISKETCENWSNRLTVIINDIETNSKHNPQVILKYFLKPS